MIMNTVIIKYITLLKTYVLIFSCDSPIVNNTDLGVQ